VYLTEAGEEFLPSARQTVEDADLGKQRILDLQGIKSGTLNIGITYIFSLEITNVIQQFLRKYPNVHLKVYYNTAQELMLMLAKRKLDLVLSLKMPTNEETFEMTDLFETPLCAVCNKQHPLAKCKSISINDLKKYTIALPTEGVSAREQLNNIMQANGSFVTPRLEINDVNILLRIVENTQYITVLAKTTVERKKSLAAIPIVEQRGNMTATLLTIRGAYQKASSKAFLSLFREEQRIQQNGK